MGVLGSSRAQVLKQRPGGGIAGCGVGLLASPSIETDKRFPDYLGSNVGLLASPSIETAREVCGHSV